VRQAALITGAGSGLGLATAREFAARGWDVYAADLRPPPGAAGIVPVTVDITDDASVAAAAAEVETRTDGLGAVINFAGILELGPMLEVAPERLSRILEINVVGTHRVNRAFFGLVRAGEGRIVNVSSEAAMIRAGATGGPYCASKKAVEAYSDALRQELMFLGVPVIVVRPGSFRTQMSQSITGKGAVDPASPFARVAEVMGRMGAKDQARAKDPAILARRVFAAVTAQRPRRYYAIGVDRLRTIGGNLPAPVVDHLVRLAVDRSTRP
jgi:NAD(P)-dependent dehydrogenase (short-subunit alcohol dehydrogenase family)